MFTDRPAPPACAALAEAKPARVVYGPATFLNQFAIQAGKLLNQQSKAAVKESRVAAAEAALRARREGLGEADQQLAAEAAAQEVLAAFQQRLLALATRYGQTGIPSLDDPTFVSSVVFDARTPDQPKSKFSYLFPSSEAALISVRLQPDLSEAERREAIELINDAVADPAFRIRNATYVVSGFPVVIEATADTLSSETFLLLAIALVVMAVALTCFVRPAAAAVAARDRARRRGADLRRARGARRLADPRRARGAAGADRARGRLRDPVPGALQRAQPQIALNGAGRG